MMMTVVRYSCSFVDVFVVALDSAAAAAAAAAVNSVVVVIDLDVPGNPNRSTTSSPAAPEASSYNNPICANERPKGEEDNKGEGAADGVVDFLFHCGCYRCGW